MAFDLHVYAHNLSENDVSDALIQKYLLSEEAERSRNMRVAPMRRFVAGRALLRYALNCLFGGAYSRKTLLFESNGKPQFNLPVSSAGPRFNISHSQDLVIVAVSSVAEVGIDVAHRKVRSRLQALAAEILSPAELAYFEQSATDAERTNEFYRFWVCKEAYLKCSGVGLNGIRSVDLTALNSTVHRMPGAGCVRTIMEFELAAEYSAALCVEGEAAPLSVTWIDTGQLLGSKLLTAD